MTDNQLAKELRELKRRRETLSRIGLCSAPSWSINSKTI
jgi:hypothetical protein